MDDPRERKARRLRSTSWAVSCSRCCGPRGSPVTFFCPSFVPVPGAVKLVSLFRADAPFVFRISKKHHTTVRKPTLGRERKSFSLVIKLSSDFLWITEGEAPVHQGMILVHIRRLTEEGPPATRSPVPWVTIARDRHSVPCCGPHWCSILRLSTSGCCAGKGGPQGHTWPRRPLLLGHGCPPVFQGTVKCSRRDFCAFFPNPASDPRPGEPSV